MTFVSQEVFLRCRHTLDREVEADASPIHGRYLSGGVTLSGAPHA
jgi:hypothetical protein